jgi:hypothetical protein
MLAATGFVTHAKTLLTGKRKNASHLFALQLVPVLKMSLNLKR